MVFNFRLYALVIGLFGAHDSLVGLDFNGTRDLYYRTVSDSIEDIALYAVSYTLLFWFNIMKIWLVQ